MSEPTRSNSDNPSTISVQLSADILAALDDLVDHHAMQSRSEAIRLILKQWLQENHVLGSDQGTRPEDLNASNDD